MFLLAAAVAAISALSLLAGVAPFAFAPLALGATGLILAYAVWKSGPVSSFLRVFIILFAVEFVITGLAYVLALKGFWPSAWDALKVPMELPLTVGLFGILSYLISFIPVVRMITRLADPYFAPSNDRVAHMPMLGTVRERWLAGGLVMSLVLINQLQVGISVRLNFFNRDWFNSLQNKDATAFWSLLLTVFLFWAAIAIVTNLIEYFIENILKLRWRDYLTEKYTREWLGTGTQYRMGFMGGTDNPDQRIAEDVRSFIANTYAFTISLISTISTLVSFSIILFSIPVQLAIPGTDIVVWGLPFWFAIIYAVVGTWLTHMIGRPLIKLDFAQERFEANFRYGLARLREYGEQIALLRGEKAERAHVRSRFTDIISNTYSIIRQNLKLNSFVSSYIQLSVVFPYIIMAPAYFAGRLTLGQLTQVAQAFGRVEASMQWFITRYQSLAAYKAVIDRLASFESAIEDADTLITKSGVTRTTAAKSDLKIPSLDLAIPSGQTIAQVRDLTMNKGQALLVTGPSGSGKSTMFRAISGIWPFGKGEIQIPADASVMLLPQRPYLPLGTLRDVALYPALAGAHSDDAINKALETARLPKLVGRLDERQIWGQVLSLGEQQRLAIARALLSKPDWLFLDEATAALDEATEAAIYIVVKRELPETTIVSIGHRSTLIAMHDRRIDLVAGAEGVFAVSGGTPATAAAKSPVKAKSAAKVTPRGKPLKPKTV